MCCGGGQNTTNSTSSTAPPEWLNSYLQQAAGQAAQVSQTPYTPYTGQRIAGISPESQNIVHSLYNSQGLGQPYVDQAQAAAARGVLPVTTADIMQGYNPFIDEQVRQLQGDFEYQNQIADQRAKSEAAKYGVVTGDRGQVLRAQTEESQRRVQDPQIAALRSGAFGQAANLAQGNQQAALQGATTFGMLGQTAQNLNLQGAQAALSGQDYIRQQQQAVEDWLYQNNYLNPQSFPYQNSAFFTQSLGGLGGLAGSTSQGTQTQPKPSLFSQLLGAGAQGVGAYLASDERIKSEIKPVGQAFNGLPIYSFKMPGQEAAQIGLLAQDVEQLDPGAVADIGGGIKGVDYERATAPAAMAGGGGVPSAAQQFADPQSRAFADTMLRAEEFDGRLTPQEYDAMAAQRALEDRLNFTRGRELVPQRAAGGPIAAGIVPRAAYERDPYAPWSERVVYPEVNALRDTPDSPWMPVVPRSDTPARIYNPERFDSRLDAPPAISREPQEYANGGTVTPPPAPVDPDFARLTTNLSQAVDAIKGHAQNPAEGYASGGGISDAVQGIVGSGLFGLLPAAAANGDVGLGALGLAGGQLGDQREETQANAQGLQNALSHFLKPAGYDAGGIVSAAKFQAPQITMTPVAPIQLPMPSGGGGGSLAKSSLSFDNSSGSGDAGLGADLGQAGAAFGKYLGTPSESVPMTAESLAGWWPGTTATTAAGDVVWSGSAAGGRVGMQEGGVPPDDLATVPSFVSPSIGLTDVQATSFVPPVGDAFAAPAAPPPTLSGIEPSELNPTGGVGVAPSPYTPATPQYDTDEGGWVEGKEWYEPGSNPALGASIAYGGAQAMAGGSPYAGINIGRGIASGISMHMRQLAAEREFRARERQAEREATRLAAALGLQRDTLDETIRANKAQEALEAAKVARTGTPGQQAVDDAFAKEYVDWNAKGGYSDVQKQLKQLKGALTKMRPKEKGGSGQEVSGPLTGVLPSIPLVGDTLAAWTTPEAVQTREEIEEVVQRNLRAVLGAQFAEKEGERLISRAFNPMLQEPENVKRVQRLYDQIEEAARAKQEASEYFRTYGTLKGWEGRLPTMGDFEASLDEIDAAEAAEKEAAAAGEGGGGGGGGGAAAGVESAASSYRDKLLALPDGPVTLGGRNYIKNGTKLMPVPNPGGGEG